jgi:3-oxoacyl-[acyl-carrier-protein] synthase-3
VATAIRATAVSTDPTVRSSIAHAAAAANECLQRGGVSAEQVDLLINVGVYRDANMAEPAMSALIQKEVGINLDFGRDPSPKPGFSFDLMNGACGALNAVQVGGAFLETGSAEYVLVVSGDAHPSTAGTPHPAGAQFPYATLGAAMLLERALGPSGRERVRRPAAGFGRLHNTTVAGSSGVEGYINLTVMENAGRHQITVERDDDYTERLARVLAASVREYAAAEELELARTLLVTSQPTPTFAAEIGAELGADAVTITGVDGDPHSSALILAYHQAAEAGWTTGYDQVLFAAAGAGLSAVCSVYRPREELVVR